jgi:hypothetical protein
MLKSILLVALVAIAAAACTTTPANQYAESSAPATKYCLTTGTRIVSKDDECSSPAGRSYSKSDIDRTGALTTADALRTLDPSISIRP